MKKITLVACISIIFFTGCGNLKDYLTRPVIEDDLEGVVSTASLSADRRTVIVKLIGQEAGKFCAEPPPDVAQNLTSSIEATLKATIPKVKIEGEGEYKETVAREIVVLAKRTVLLDIYRTGTYSLCQFHLNKGINPNELITRFDALTEAVITGVYKIKAENE